ncbi:M56 family metallopeptidase [Bradyrhizobium sp. HKCCYLS1011]|uniref:M56 family metallopeptidase n=1 Tax=Bradyrhizobium sp. HKCCYLS1011 TaxID=3420733 RepID=UPI003EB950F3
MLTVLAEAALRTVLLGSVVGFGLYLFRVRHPQLQMTAWLVVLAASLVMPLLMHWSTVTITLHAPQAASIRPVGPIEDLLPASAPAPVPDEFEAVEVAPIASVHVVSPWTIATIIYLLVAGCLLLRLAIGLRLTYRLVRKARPLPGGQTADLRISDVIASPVTIGSTILVPSQWLSWDAVKREAVLAHERSHIANRDFYVLLIAAVNRALFWFSPFAWWQYRRLADLAEMISDASAIEALDDHVSYAEILLEIVQAPRGSAVALEMARASTVRARIERILGGGAGQAKVRLRGRIAVAAAILPAIIVSALAIATRTEMAKAKAVAGPNELGMPAQKAERISFYSLGPRGVFAISRHGDALFGQLTGQRRLRLASIGQGAYSYADTTGLLSFVVGNDAPPELVVHQESRKWQAGRIAELSPCDSEAEARPAADYLGWYELSPSRVLAVTASGERLQFRETGRGSFEVKADCPDAYSSASDDLVLFLRDGKEQVTRLLLQDPLLGARVAHRVDEPRAKEIEDNFARRMAEVPDRFREQVPTPGSREMVLRGIADLQRGAPNYERMGAALASYIRQHMSSLRSTLVTLGDVQSIFFRGVGGGGYDIYGVKFANGSAEFRILVGPEGRVDDVLFRPDGNDAPGEVLNCASEANLRAQPDQTPIKLMIYNATGAEIRLFRVDAQGRRSPHGVVEDDLSSSFLTEIGSPWIVADANGHCLEIILPGRRTRYNMVEAQRIGSAADHFGERRGAPAPGSEDKLRRYIESIAEGHPDYEHMTTEVAAYTRQQLAMNQAILARLGALRAISFRGVTALDSDIYMVHFANGTAEWRIGLARDGSIGRIALGPSY